MSAIDTPTVCEVAIVGGGAAGVLAAIGILRGACQPLRLLMIEPSLPLARGVAYATPREEHVLNVPAAKMSGFPEQPEDFLDYLGTVPAFAGVPRETLAAQFVSRGHYANYLRERLQQAVDTSPAQLEIIAARVQALQPEVDAVRLRLDSGRDVQAGKVILAVGNALRPLPARGAGSLPEAKRIEAWDYAALANISAAADVAIIGSGLSMADAVATLQANGHRGRIHVMSRHALLPLPHAKGAPADYDPEPLLAMNLRQRLHALRQHAAEAAARGIPWQSVMERIRPLGQALWQSLSADDQRRFLRHVVRYWDVHRHRIAAPLHAQLLDVQQQGRLQLHRGRLETAVAEGACVRLAGLDRWRRPLQLEVQCVINATGVEMRAQAMRNPLLQQLLGSGVGRAGPHGIGVDTAPDGSLVDAEGVAEPRVQVIGSLRIGSLWESLAIPDLRGQAAVAAKQAL